MREKACHNELNREMAGGETEAKVICPRSYNRSVGDLDIELKTLDPLYIPLLQPWLPIALCSFEIDLTPQISARTRILQILREKRFIMETQLSLYQSETPAGQCSEKGEKKKKNNLTYVTFMIK